MLSFVCSCPSRDKFPLIETEDKALVRRLRGTAPPAAPPVELLLTLTESPGGLLTVYPSLSSSSFSTADIQQKDREVLELLQERVSLFSDLVQVAARGETEEERGVEVKTSTCRNLFRADTPHAPKAEPLLLAAMSEGKEPPLGPPPGPARRTQPVCLFCFSRQTGCSAVPVQLPEVLHEQRQPGDLQ